MPAKPVATIGSMHVCPLCNGTVPHVGGPVSGPGAPNVLINGKPVAVMGDMCVCIGTPDTIVQGSSSVLVNGTPVACVGDLTAHGGCITVGEANVVISTATPNSKVTMPLKEIPFPKINVLTIVGSAIIGRSKQLKEAKENIEQIKALLKEHNAEHIQVIAKIENQAGLDNIDGILEAADGIMYARGDLGVEVLPEELPHYQKEVVDKTRQAGKLMIVATQMVESMQSNPVPTRAEVSDVANAVYDSVDTVMLSGEMAAGKYPIEAVKMMKRIVKTTEKHVDYDEFLFPVYSGNEELDSVAFMAITAAATHDIKAIVTDSLELTMQITKYRPQAIVIPHVTKVEATKAYSYFNSYPVVGDLNKLNLEVAKLNKGDLYLVATNTGITLNKF